MYTLNNHQLWSRNIYDHALMILSIVPTHQHQSNQNRRLKTKLGIYKTLSMT